MNHLQAIMEAKGMTQTELAKRTGLTQGFISKVVAGAEPRVTKALMIARVLGVTVESLWEVE